MDRIITRILLAFWAVWFALRAFAAFGGGAGGALEHSWARMGAISLSAGLVEMLIGWLLAWALLAISLGGREKADALLVVKFALASAIAFAAAGCLLKSGNTGGFPPLEMVTMLLLVASFVAVESEAASMDSDVRTELPAAEMPRIVPTGPHETRIIRFPAKGHHGVGEST